MCDYVRSSMSFIESNASHVKVNSQKLREKVLPHLDEIISYKFDTSIHVAPQDVESRLRYILLVDALNFCFWPTANFEYDNLTVGLTKLEKDHPEYFEPEHMTEITPEILAHYLVFQNSPIPNISERTRLFKEVGEVLVKRFNSKAENLIVETQGCASALVTLIAKEFPGFRDSTVYKGRQVFFYKRAQIVVGDISGMCDNIKHLEELTGFADYRIPQLLLGWDCLDFLDQSLKEKIINKIEISAGSEEECELRCTVLSAIKIIQKSIEEIKHEKVNGNVIDWFLWSTGEKNKDNLPPHHRTNTIFY
ncbi:hypothetical protein EIN_155380 [Entamoeba invadens IP1]|uniref:Queuosine 5'-phosphate N-glycosylase/hydrolase n=1 Tax=Entamoeba invadens IP1 TaxID=370355 RepID=A0A0A1UF55_ENTIV|nr:hypothetical protein EIN_155380 [Entamoeba invadens IP1]ELP91431.1 hypothetical protein EIN_155380 [Entamoeba invadens IP1]|eukprot:XP_004258202.1 hypothetical protein EIN_155380 [Entamoeba invadens IP1]